VIKWLYKDRQIWGSCYCFLNVIFLRHSTVLCIAWSGVHFRFWNVFTMHLRNFYSSFFDTAWFVQLEKTFLSANFEMFSVVIFMQIIQFITYRRFPCVASPENCIPTNINKFIYTCFISDVQSKSCTILICFRDSENNIRSASITWLSLWKVWVK
jgi:hypothetical protein